MCIELLVLSVIPVVVLSEEDVDCGNPPEEENGEIISMSMRTTVDSVVTYKCSDDYQFQEGNNMSRTCLASRNWSEENILCSRFICMSQQAIFHVVFHKM